MNNKVILVLLALLVIIAGGTAYYSYTLNQRLDTLGQTFSDYQVVQAERLSAMRDNLAGLEVETGNRLDALGSQLAGARGDITSLTAAWRRTRTGWRPSRRSSRGHLGQRQRHFPAGSTLQRPGCRACSTPAPPTPRSARPRSASPTAVNVIGSGFIYDSLGHVVTAYHVINGLSPIVVITDDGRFFDAEVTGYSEASDVAVLKLDGDPAIAPPALGDSARVRIGDQVVAIGSPLDIRDTLTAGVISQVNRYTNYGVDDNSVPNLLQFDAPVNPGNSGGPLVNGSGEVIGVVVARIIAGQGDGIYYAVASNKVKRVAEAIIASGSFPYPWLGVNIADLTPDDAQASGTGHDQRDQRRQRRSRRAGSGRRHPLRRYHYLHQRACRAQYRRAYLFPG